MDAKRKALDTALVPAKRPRNDIIALADEKRSRNIVEKLVSWKSCYFKQLSILTNTGTHLFVLSSYV